MVHRSLGLLDTLLSTLARTRHSFCLYVDAKAHKAFKKGVGSLVECYKKKFPKVKNF